MKVSTRAAHADDKSQVWAFYEAAMRPHIDLIWGWDIAWQLAHFDEAYAVAATYIIDVDGVRAGYIQLDLGDTANYLRMLVIAPAFQSRGVGATLLTELLRVSGGHGRALSLRVFRTNGAAKRFYEREGWYVAEDQGDFILMNHAQSRAVGAAVAAADAPAGRDFELSLSIPASAAARQPAPRQLAI